MTVASCCVVATVEADAAAPAARQLVQLHVETAATGVQVTVTRCREGQTRHLTDELKHGAFSKNSLKTR